MTRAKAERIFNGFIREHELIKPETKTWSRQGEDWKVVVLLPKNRMPDAAAWACELGGELKYGDPIVEGRTADQAFMAEGRLPGGVLVSMCAHVEYSLFTPAAMAA